MSLQQEKIKQRKYGNKPEWLVIALYAAALAVAGIYHEPWFDEAQAWQIAKCASFYDILFTLPHIEGHPPLWHLILAIPAKLGAPYEFSLKLIGLFFSVSAIALIELKSPFPRWIKLALPFTYFLFYQYGVIVRPYSLMLLAFICTALSFENRNSRPGRFVLSLMFLCLTIAYGIAFAGGIAVCWLYEIVKERKGSVQELIKDRRVWWLAALLVLALLIIGMINPRSEAVALTDDGKQNARWLCVLVVLLTFLSNCFLSSTGWLASDRIKLQTASLSWDSFFPAMICDAVLWLLIISCSTKKNVKYLAVPYVFFALFSGIVYISGHHIGIAVLFLVFWFWIGLKDKNRFETGRLLIQRFCLSEKDIKLVKRFGIGMCLISIVLPLSWTVSSVIVDGKENYSYGREIADFIKENKLEGLKIACAFGEKDGAVDVSKAIDFSKIETVYNATPVPIAAYFKRNPFYTFNNGRDDRMYCVHALTDANTSMENICLWREAGAPELLIGPVDVGLITNGQYSLNDDYTPVYRCYFGGIWKGTQAESAALLLFLRSDLMEKYQMQKIELPPGINNDLSLTLIITDEIRKAYEAGEDYQALLDEQFDYMLGLERE